MRSLVMRALLGLVLVMLVSPACSKETATPEKTDSGSDAIGAHTPMERCPADVDQLPEGVQQGVCVAHNYQRKGRRGYGSATSLETLKELRALGVEWVSLTPFGFMRSLSDPEVHPIGNVPAGETDDRMRKEIRAAKKLGLHVLLKPHIWIIGGAWRGNIDPGSAAAWSQWFKSYERWILHYAELAAEEGADELVIGVELKSTERRFQDRWRRLAAKVRKRFKGNITYSANWDDASRVPWWDAVDYISVQFYPPLADKGDATHAEVTQRLNARLDELESLANAQKQRVSFTEVGFRSAPGAHVHPHEWPERANAQAADVGVQALGYRVFLRSIQDRPWVRGVYWWKWFTDPKTAEEGPTGFSPRKKPAEGVLRAAYGGDCESARAQPD